MTTQPSDWAVELLPCPFCSNDVVDDEGCFQAGGFRPPSTPHWVVRCGNPSCNAETSAVNRDDAIAAWNRRAPVARELDASGGVPDDAMAMHWIDRYAAGLDDECQLDRIREALAPRAAEAGDAEAAFKDWYWKNGADWNSANIKPVWMAAWSAAMAAEAVGD